MPVHEQGKNKWRIVISNGFNQLTGERIRITKTVYAENKTEAEKLEKIMAAEIVKKHSIAPSKMTLQEFFDYWLTNYAYPTLENKTITSYKGLFYRVGLALGHKPIDKIESKHILLFFQILRTCPRLDKKEGTLSGATLKKTYALLHTLFHKAEKWNFIITNPMDSVDPPKYRYRNKKTILNKQEIGEFLLALNDVEMKYRIWCEMAILGGFRREEIYGLQWKHISFKRNTITVEQACSYTKEKGTHIKSTKNTASERLVSVSDNFIRQLKEYYSFQNKKRQMVANKWEGGECIEEDYVFNTWNGRMCHPDTISKWLRKFRQAHNFPDITPHSFRHMTATYLINAGVDLVTVAGKLGHADSTTTQVVYAHLLKKSEQETANVMGRIVSESVAEAKEAAKK